MKKWVLAATAALGLAGSAQAGVITLTGVTDNGPGDFTWTYQGTLGPDEGLRAGDKLIIFDFAGYIDGSISSPFANVTSSVEFTSPSAIVTPGTPVSLASCVPLALSSKYTMPSMRPPERNCFRAETQCHRGRILEASPSRAAAYL